jgi:uncharacterized membrane protein YphA (DoxX/SURF4 family)
MVNISVTNAPILILLVFFAITFIQSGIDKLLNTQGNMDWFKSQFKETFLNSIIVPSFWLITIQEIIAGFSALAVFFMILFNLSLSYILFYVFVIQAFVLLQLFFGQRIAKDYVGASGIVPYLITSILAHFYLLNFHTVLFK